MWRHTGSVPGFISNWLTWPIGVLSPEQAWKSAETLPRIADIEALVPVESWRVGDSHADGEMTRYRLTRAGAQRYLVAAWTPDDRLYWLA